MLTPVGFTDVISRFKGHFAETLVKVFNYRPKHGGDVINRDREKHRNSAKEYKCPKVLASYLNWTNSKIHGKSGNRRQR